MREDNAAQEHEDVDGVKPTDVEVGVSGRTRDPWQMHACNGWKEGYGINSPQRIY
jgi:hypothetical protein